MAGYPVPLPNFAECWRSGVSRTSARPGRGAGPAGQETATGIGAGMVTGMAAKEIRPGASIGVTAGMSRVISG
jgi:hypothetical protein